MRRFTTTRCTRARDPRDPTPSSQSMRRAASLHCNSGCRGACATVLAVGGRGTPLYCRRCENTRSAAHGRPPRSPSRPRQWSSRCGAGGHRPYGGWCVGVGRWGRFFQRPRSTLFAARRPGSRTPPHSIARGNACGAIWGHTPGHDDPLSTVLVRESRNPRCRRPQRRNPVAFEPLR